MIRIRNIVPVAIIAGFIAFTAQTAEAAAPPRTMDLEILANGQLLLRGELIDSIDALEARLRVMRENEPPFELSLRLPKTFNIDLSAIMKALQGFGFHFGPIGNSSPPPKPTPIDSSI
jgi:hypothetical protein